MYKLEVDEEQLRLIQEALDLHSRIILGQFEEVGRMATMYNINMLGDSHTINKNEYEKHHLFTDKLRSLKPLLGFHENSSYGIFNKEIHEHSRHAYDIIQVIRKHLAEKYYKEGDSRMGIHFDMPTKTSNKELPKIEEIILTK